LGLGDKRGTDCAEAASGRFRVGDADESGSVAYRLTSGWRRRQV